MYCLQVIHFRPKGTYKQKARGWKITFHTSGNQEKVGVTILKCVQIDLKKRQGKWYIMIKGSFQEEYITIVNIYTPNMCYCCWVINSYLWLHDLQQASLSFTILQSLLRLMFIELAMLSKHLIFCCHLLILLSIFCSTRVFSSESALHTRWTNIGTP